MGIAGFVFQAFRLIHSLDAIENVQISLEIAGGGRAVVVVSHDPRLVESADRVVRLRDGEVHSDERNGKVGA